MEQTRKQVIIRTVVNAPIEKVWEYWTEPKHIQKWNAASADWHTPTATNDLRVGGEFHCRMEAKDQSEGFDFWGIYTDIVPLVRIAHTMGDGRKVEVLFEQTGEGVGITESFEIEDVHSEELQRNGWQSILDNFKKYADEQSG